MEGRQGNKKGINREIKGRKERGGCVKGQALFLA